MTDQQTIEQPLYQQLSRIDEPMERRRVGDMVVNKWAGLTFNEYREAIEFAKMMAQGRNSIPPYLKANNGDCLAIVTQALRWRLEPFWVAQHSYVAKTESLIAYDAAVHNAIVLSSGLLKTRPRYVYSGEGEERRCTVFATFIGESDPHEYETPPLKQCRPKRNEQGQVRGSPLWDKDVDQQLGYFAIRNWGRRHMPDILGGIYDRDEFENTTQEATEPKDVSPNLMARLPGKMEGAGFKVDVIDEGLAKRTEKIQEEAKTKKAAKATEKPAEEASAEILPKDTVITPTSRGAEYKPAVAYAGHKVEKAAEVELGPATAEQYVAYAAKWIELATDPDNLEARWDGEGEMRASLKLPLAARKRLQGMATSRAAELRKVKP